MKAIKINMDDSGEIIEVNGLHDMQEAVGGYIEAVTIRNDYLMIVNEEGLINHLHVNLKATRINGWDPIFGDVLIIKECIVNGELDIVGLDDEEIREFVSHWSTIEWKEGTPGAEKT